MKTLAMALCAVIGWSIGSSGWAQAPATAKDAVVPPAAAKDENTADYQAQKLLRKGIALIDDRQDERGLKVIASVPLNYPKSPVRFAAALYLGKYYAEKGDFLIAVKNLTPVTEADDAGPNERAEAYYRIGICQYGLADHNRALALLRKVTEEFPWSIYANEAYYYIGLCHFKMNRWRKAVDALKMVGTSVPANTAAQNFAEAGQRFYIKIQDKDLRVLKNIGGLLTVAVKAQSGDSESVPMSVFDTEGEFFLGSIKTELGRAQTNDGGLQIAGGDIITVDYNDANTQDGGLQVKRAASSRVVSTAAIGFMDGAYREYVHGVIAGQRTFVRVKDFDADKSDQKDKVMLRIYAQYKAATNELEAVTEVTQESEPEYAIRDTLDLTLEETEPHSGFFAGMLMVEDSKNPAAVNKSDAKLEAVEKDQIVMEYVDKEHFGGLDTPRTATARAAFLTGQIQDVAIAHREADTEDLRARKNLIEAKFYLRLATIFKDVGLVARAKEKADVGLEKADDILRRSVRASLDQDLIEEAYRLKWELQLAKGDMASAINTCYLLMSLYPTSSLADVALLQIAKARIEAKQTQDALQILSGLLQLKGNPDLKAEAQFLIASVLEENVNKKLPKEERLRAMGQAIDAYRACADKYPGSPFAGQALGKVIDFHIESRDYNRCLELLQTVFTDFPDASFLDEMLLKWGVVLAQMQRYSDSLEKLQQVINEYPNSTAASKATKVLDVVSKKVK